ncbi:MAG: hypothetical protein R3D02_17080, partial [Hyphomicrobiales bacterium]
GHDTPGLAAAAGPHPSQPFENKMNSRFRGNDGTAVAGPARWIPAFAGMTALLWPDQHAGFPLSRE